MGALPACSSKTLALNRFIEGLTPVCERCADRYLCQGEHYLQSASRGEGFSRSNTKRLPARGTKPKKVSPCASSMTLYTRRLAPRYIVFLLGVRKRIQACSSARLSKQEPPVVASSAKG